MEILDAVILGIRAYNTVPDLKYHQSNLMEYVKNGTLEDRLKRDQRLEPLEVLKVAIEVGRALGYMQSQEIIHRDIKPGNILISEDGTYKLSDFYIKKNYFSVKII